MTRTRPICARDRMVRAARDPAREGPMPNLHAGMNAGPGGSGESFAPAAIVGSTGSVAHPAGTSKPIRGEGRITGSLSGGCIKVALVAAAPRCGGEMEVRIAPFRARTPLNRLLRACAAAPAAFPVALESPRSPTGPDRQAHAPAGTATGAPLDFGSGALRGAESRRGAGRRTPSWT